MLILLRSCVFLSIGLYFQVPESSCGAAYNERLRESGVPLNRSSWFSSLRASPRVATLYYKGQPGLCVTNTSSCCEYPGAFLMANTADFETGPEGPELED